MGRWGRLKHGPMSVRRCFQAEMLNKRQICVLPQMLYWAGDAGAVRRPLGSSALMKEATSDCDDAVFVVKC